MSASWRAWILIAVAGAAGGRALASAHDALSAVQVLREGDALEH